MDAWVIALIAVGSAVVVIACIVFLVVLYIYLSRRKKKIPSPTRSLRFADQPTFVESGNYSASDSDIVVRITRGSDAGKIGVITKIGADLEGIQRILQHPDEKHQLQVTITSDLSCPEVVLRPSDLEVIRESFCNYDVTGTDLAPIHLNIKGAPGKIRGTEEGYIVVEFPGVPDPGPFRLLPCHVVLLREYTNKDTNIERYLSGKRLLSMDTPDSMYPTIVADSPNVDKERVLLGSLRDPKTDDENEFFETEPEKAFGSPELNGAHNVAEVTSFHPLRMSVKEGHPVSLYHTPMGVPDFSSIAPGGAGMESMMADSIPFAIPHNGRGQPMSEPRSIRHYVHSAGISNENSASRPSFKPEITYRGAPPEATVIERNDEKQIELLRAADIMHEQDREGSIEPVYSSNNRRRRFNSVTEKERSRYEPVRGMYNYENTTASKGFVPKVSKGDPAGSRLKALRARHANDLKKSSAYQSKADYDEVAMQTSPIRRHHMKERLHEVDTVDVNEYIESLQLTEDITKQMNINPIETAVTIASSASPPQRESRFMVTSSSPLSNTNPILQLKSMFAALRESSASPGGSDLTRKVRMQRVEPYGTFHKSLVNYRQASKATHPTPLEDYEEKEIDEAALKAFRVRGGCRELLATLCMAHPDSYADGQLDWLLRHVRTDTYSSFLQDEAARVAPNTPLSTLLATPKDFIVPFPNMLYVRGHPALSHTKSFILQTNGERRENLPIYKSPTTGATLMSVNGKWVVRSGLNRTLMQGVYGHSFHSPLETFLWELPGDGEEEVMAANPEVHLVEGRDDQLKGAFKEDIIAGVVKTDSSDVSFAWEVPETVVSKHHGGCTVRVSREVAEKHHKKKDRFVQVFGSLFAGKKRADPIDAEIDTQHNVVFEVEGTSQLCVATKGDTLTLKRDAAGYFIQIVPGSEFRFYLPASPFLLIGRLKKACNVAGINEALHQQWQTLRAQLPYDDLPEPSEHLEKTLSDPRSRATTLLSGASGPRERPLPDIPIETEIDEHGNVREVDFVPGAVPGEVQEGSYIEQDDSARFEPRTPAGALGNTMGGDGGAGGYNNPQDYGNNPEVDHVQGAYQSIEERYEEQDVAPVAPPQPPRRKQRGRSSREISGSV